MKISTILQNIRTHLTAAYTKLAAKGATLPANKNFSNLANTIDTVKTQLNLQTKSSTISTNGTTTISKDNDYDGMSSVSVTTNIQPTLQSKTNSSTANGTMTVSPDNGYNGLSSVTVTTNVQPNLFTSTMWESYTYNGTHVISTLTDYDGFSQYSVTTQVTNKFPNCISGESFSLSKNDLYGATKIAEYAFYYCTGLTSISIPDTVTSIGNSAFSNCTGLTSITIQATTPPTLSSTNAFNSTNSCPIYVPSASLSAYQSATNWSSLSSRLQGY